MAEKIDPPTTTTSSPSNPAASSPLPPPPANPSQPKQSQSKNALQKIRALLFHCLAASLRKTDRTILRLSSLLSKPTTTDNLLCTTSYILSLLHALLSRLLARHISALAASVATKATPVLLPGETFVAALPAPAATQLLAQTTASVKALAGLISDYRIFVRLWGLVDIYTWARGTWNTPLTGDATGKEKLLRGVTWGAIASCIGFQVLENGAYLASKGVLTGEGWAGDQGRKRESTWWIWSSRFWAAYVLLELTRLGLVRYYDGAVVKRVETTNGEEKSVLEDGEKEAKLLKEESRKNEALWWRDLASNLAYMPMTLHWSVEEDRGILSDWGVGALGTVAGGANLVHAWRNTA
ncbi:hypothetical protein DM02DRAFT_731944 [Periconia macrospinosa]|uniref:Peroxin 11C n=1 Tax=Periconia macrospinosa TaxID=97972 RepID=A0A2V1DAZ2_9PLEO|nr:hypothetical protein DM02DRAFT_731944 [Periconia macrospinosa]